jgi:hypothetical protein
MVAVTASDQEEVRMKTKIAPLVTALMLLSSLVISDLPLVKGQAVGMDKRMRLSTYGVVLSIPGPDRKGITLLHEGYAIAYRATNPRTGEEEDRLAYAFGAQQIGNLEPVKQEGTRTIARTRDGALEITSEAKWDEKLRQLQTWRSIKVTAATEVTITAIESHADAARQANNGAQRVTPVQAALVAGPAIGGRDGECECPPCSPNRPCRGSFLSSGAYQAMLNLTETSKVDPTLIASSVGMPTMKQMSSGNFVSVLSWVRGVNMPTGPSAPSDGQSYFASFQIE